MKKLFIIFSLALCCGVALGQSTVVSGTLVDPQGNTWSAASITAVFTNAPNIPGPYHWDGGVINQLPATVTSDAGGTFSITLPTNVGHITPSGSTWLFSICPNASLQCAVVNVALSGSTFNIVPTITGAGAWPVGPVVPTTISKVYNTNQTATPPQSQGGMVYNTTNQTMNIYTSTGWQPFAFVGGLPVITNPSGNQNIVQPIGSSLNANTFNYILYSQPGDTFNSIEASCAAITSTGCTYIVTIPQVFTLASNRILNPLIAVEFKNGGKWTVNGSGNTLTIGSGMVTGPNNSQILAGSAIINGLTTTRPEWCGSTTIGNCVVSSITTKAAITAFSISSNVVTFTANNNNIIAGNPVLIRGLITGSYLDEQIYNVVSSTQNSFTVNFTHSNVSNTSDSGFGWGGGGTILLQNTTYTSGFSSFPNNCIQASNVSLIGTSRPNFSTDFTKLQSGSGTIIKGGIKFCANNVTVKHLGIDVGSAYVAAGGTENDGLDLDGPNIATEDTSDPILQNALIEDVSALGKNPSSQYHAFRVEHYNNATIRNIEAVYGTHGIAFKSINSTLDGGYFRGHQSDGIAIKGDLYTQVHDESVSNLVIQSITPGDTNGISISASEATGTLTHIQVSNALLTNLFEGVVFLNTSTVGDGAVSDVQVSNIKIFENTISGNTPICVFFNNSITPVSYPVRFVQLNNISCVNASGQASSLLTMYSPAYQSQINNWLSVSQGFPSQILGQFDINGWSDTGPSSSIATFTSADNSTNVHVSGYYSNRSNSVIAGGSLGTIAVLPNADGMQQSADGSQIIVLKPLNGVSSSNNNIPIAGALSGIPSNALNIRGGAGSSTISAFQDTTGTANYMTIGSSGLGWSGSHTISTNISSSTNVVQSTGSVTGKAACIKAGGPPVIIGSCSTTVDASGACSCN